MIMILYFFLHELIINNPGILNSIMKITVKLFATLRKDRFEKDNREYEPGTIVSQVIND